MRKSAIIFLLVCFTFCNLCSCLNNQELSDNENNISEEPKRDLEGFEMIWTQTGDATTSPFGYLENSVFADSALKRKLDTETELNCKITLIGVDYFQMASQLLAASLVGDVYSDIVVTSDEVTKDMMKSDLLLPLDEVASIIDLQDSKKWGTPGMLETVMLDSRIYGVRPSLWPERFPDFYTPIIFNQKLTSLGGHNDPREYVEKGSWTRSKFIELIQDCTQRDESNYIYGMSVNSQFMFEMAIRANNGRIVKKEGDVYVNATGDPESIEAMQWVIDTVKENTDCFVNKAVQATWTVYLDPFLAEQAAMLMYPTWGLFGNVGMKIDNWGLLPFPNGPNREYGDWTAFYEGNGNFISITNTSNDIENTAYILNEMCRPLDEYPTYEDLMSFYERNLFHDHRDFELFFHMGENCRYNYWKEGGNRIVVSMASSLYKKTPKEIVDANDKAFQVIIDKYIAGNQPYFENIENIREIGE